LRIFISYAHKNKDLIEEIVKILRAGGHDPRFDHDLIVGQYWEQQLRQAIRSCDAFVYALTPESVESEYCR
jgi:hypothetical protein